MRLMHAIYRVVPLALIALIVGAAESPAKEGKKIAIGVITAVDEKGKSFSCHWKAKDGKTTDWTYLTNEKTAFELNSKKAMFADLKVGEKVQVKFHRVEKDRVADAVTITAQ